MSAMAGMPMPGGWTMSMAWMRMPGQTWPGAASAFVGMWVLMMVPMMLPSTVPPLLRYRAALARTGETRLGWLTALAGAGYFVVWTVLGMAVYPMGVLLASVEMGIPAVSEPVPMVVGVIVLVAGLVQFTPWKARHLACCREEDGHRPTAGAGAAFRHGLGLGLRCSRCCANLMLIPLVTGVMDLPVMASVAAAITIERLAPSGGPAARSIGALIVGSGLLLCARAAGLA
jgi:predicted metal-binding membrane protein